MLRVLLVNDRHYDYSEAEKYYFNVAELLEEKGHEVSFFSVNDPENYETDCKEIMVEPIKIDEQTMRNKLKSLEIIYSKPNKDKMLEAINYVRPNIIHIFGFEDKLSPSIIDIAISRKIPIVYSAHNLKPFCPADRMVYKGKKCDECKYGSYIECLRRRCIENSEEKSRFASLKGMTYRLKKVYEKMDYITVTSEFMKNMFIESGINNKNIEVIPNFVDVDKYEELEPRIGKYALYIGDLVEEKGVMDLVKAFSGIEEGKLYIAGNGPLKPKIKNYIVRKQLQDKIKIVGNLDEEVLIKLLKDCRFLVYPTLKYESCPSEIAEALVMGKPIIAPEVGGIPELIRNGKNGLLYEYNDIIGLTDAMINLFEDVELVKVLGRNSKEIAKEAFSKSIYYKKLLGIYNLINRRSGI